MPDDPGPCQCWTRVPAIPHGNHCCFGYPDPDGDAYQYGQPPPCGHWHPDVPRPPKLTDDQAHAWVRHRCIECLSAPARAAGYRCDACFQKTERGEATA